MTRTSAIRAILFAAITSSLNAPSALAWTVNGTVVTVQYWPIHGATVRIASARDGVEVESCVSNDLGDFQFESDIPDGNYRFSVEHPDYLPVASIESINANRTMYFNLSKEIPRKLP